ncbi:hypothetical protein EV401DRAFT_385174 [Pisolithus croceorrhizus]|nr:hypothetical protein EV401DRAFT_385174 [Pisolithus croceorrhizus]
MAAKGGHRLSLSPRFPAEVWEHIFGFATHVPCTLVSELYAKRECIGDQRSALESALATKRNLVLVCKWWQHMAMRYLYRVVLIRTGRNILVLDHTLRNYAMGNGSFVGMRSPGHWTRRLDITLHPSNESECEDPDRCVKRLADVIQFLPKLEIVSFAITCALGSEPNIMPFNVLDALRCSADSLRTLDWSGDDFFPRLHQLEELLRDLPNLRSGGTIDAPVHHHIPCCKHSKKVFPSFGLLLDPLFLPQIGNICSRILSSQPVSVTVTPGVLQYNEFSILHRFSIPRLETRFEDTNSMASQSTGAKRRNVLRGLVYHFFPPHLCTS